MIRSYAYKIPQQPRRSKLRTHYVVVRKFQYRYAIFLSSFGLFLCIIVGGLTLYFLNHNYQLMVKAALVTSPRVVDNLYRELKLANELIVSSQVVFVAFLALLGIRVSHRIVVPIMLVQDKMREICKGILKNGHVRFRKTDEFQELSETYNYMVDSLRSQIKSDLQRLEELKPNEKDRDAVHTWRCMIEEKEAQLNGTSAQADSNPVSHHAS